MIELILSGLGYLILKYRYPNTYKRQQIFEDVYDSSYLNVGSEPFLKIGASFLFILLSLFLIAAIYAVFRHGPVPD